MVVWNGTLDQSRAAGHATLDRRVELTLRGLEAPAYELTALDRLDELEPTGISMIELNPIVA